MAKQKKTPTKKVGLVAAGKRKPWMNSLYEGRPLSLGFFMRHAWFILIAMTLVIVLIGQRYSNQTKVQEINKLTKELSRAESEQVNEKAQYMSLIRENEMRKLLHSHHLDLDYQDKPPYIIEAD